MTPDVLALLRAGASDRAVERATGVERRRVARIRAQAGIAPWSPPAAEHGTSGRWRRCDCETCQEARARYAAAEYARSGRTTGDGAMREEAAELLHARSRADLARTAVAATVRGRWSADEIAYALDYAHSAVQVAEHLGRSLASVRHVRRRYADQATVSGPMPRGRRAHT